MTLLWAMAAMAGEWRPVESGDTIESLSGGDEDLARQLRELNELGADEQPVVGTLFQFPDSGGTSQRSFVVSLNGSGTRTTGTVTTPLIAYTPVDPGTLVCTAENSTAILRVSSQCTNGGDRTDDLLLRASTCVQVESAVASDKGRATVVRLTTGSLEVLEAPDGQGHVTIVTPAGITTGPKGGFRVALEKDSAARTEAIAGEAMVAGSGAEVSLASGQGSRTRVGEAPSPPVDLLVVDTLFMPAEDAYLYRPVFAWAPVEGALGYSAQFASRADQMDVLLRTDIPTSTWTPRVLMLPYGQIDTFWWSITAFDRFGFEGVPSTPRKLRIPEGIR